MSEVGVSLKTPIGYSFRGYSFYCIVMSKLSKAIYNNNIGDRHAVKALALFVFVKENKPTSVFTDYTITALAKFASPSRNTTRNRIRKLVEMGLVERVGKNRQHLLFKRARAKCANVNL